MLRHSLTAAGLAALAFAGVARSQTKPLTHEQVREYLYRIRNGFARGLAVEPPEGEFLYNQVKKYGAKRVLELGTADGYSGIWLALGLRENGGKLITIELDEKRYAQATKNFAATGLDGIIDARNANALTETEKVEGPLDLVFIDAWKNDYIKYLKMVLPKVRKGGVIIAHNIYNNATGMLDFIEEIKTNRALKTEFFSLGTGQGLSLSIKQ